VAVPFGGPSRDPFDGTEETGPFEGPRRRPLATVKEVLRRLLPKRCPPRAALFGGPLVGARVDGSLQGPLLAAPFFGPRLVPVCGLCSLLVCLGTGFGPAALELGFGAAALEAVPRKGVFQEAQSPLPFGPKAHKCHNRNKAGFGPLRLNSWDFMKGAAQNAISNWCWVSLLDSSRLLYGPLGRSLGSLHCPLPSGDGPKTALETVP